MFPALYVKDIRSIAPGQSAFLRAAFLAFCLLAFYQPLCAEGPVWEFPGNEQEIRRNLRGWLNLDERALSERARQSLSKDRSDVRGAAENFIGLWLSTGQQSFRRNAGTILDALIEDAGANIGSTITPEGSKDAANIKARDISLEYALRYLIGKNPADAEEVKNILRNFAAVIPGWPLWDSTGARRSQNDRSFHRRWDGRGLWGGWHHQELEHSFPLLRAYDIVRGEITEGERRFIEDNIFRHQKELMDNWFYFSNMLGSILLGQARFGLVLREPAYIHEVLQIYRQMIYLGFFPDGFYREVSGSYHAMPVARLAARLPAIIDGYSDPAGYIHPDTGRRIDSLDLSGEYSRHHQRWWSVMNKLTLPNRRILCLNDSTARRAAGAFVLPHTDVRLLGASGVAMLGAGGEKTPQQLYLLFADTHGHEHSDALNIAWFAHGREVFSETDYRPLPGSGSTRAWQASTAGHNTVVMDERNQHNRFQGKRRALTPDDALLGEQTWRGRPLAMNKPNLLLFDHSWPEVQAMEAEAENSYYPTAELYRRTLALVDLGGGDGYLVDIFRVRGGARHDYMLHGCLDEEYTAEWDVPLREVDETIFDLIKVHSRGAAKPPFSFSFIYRDGLRTISRVLSPGTHDGVGIQGVNLNIGRAPAMRRMGEAEFVALRRHGGAELGAPGQENTFVVVHEVFKDGGTKIESAGLMPHESNDPEAVTLRVVLKDGREDVFLSTLGEGAVKLEDGTEFEGRLGYLRRYGGRARAGRIFDGRKLVSGCGAVSIEGLPPLGGRVRDTQRLDDGDGGEGIVVSGLHGDAGELAGRTLFVEMDSGRDYVWAYSITGADSAGDETVIWVEHDPGFEIREDGALTKLLYHPGWGFRSPAYWRIAPAAQSE